MLRAAVDLGQVKSVASDLQISHQAVSQLLAGGRPSADTMARAELHQKIPAVAWLQGPTIATDEAEPQALLAKQSLPAPEPHVIVSKERAGE